MDQPCIDLCLRVPLNYHMTGTFVAPSEQWMHADFDLTDFELIVETEETLYIEYRGQQFAVHPGEYLLLPPGSAPDNRRKGWKASACTFYWLHCMTPLSFLITTTEAPKPAEGTIRIPLQGRIPNMDKLAVLLRQLQNDVRLGYPAITLNYEATAIFCELYSQLGRTGKADNSERLQKQIYSDIVDYIHMNTSVNLTVSDVARRFGYNEKYLSHLFNRLSGMPLKQFILKCKMDDANFLLTDTNLSITEIARRLGYSDPHNFTRAYKKMTDISPSAYRETYAQRLLYHV